MCNCEFDPYDPADNPEGEESWHYKRTCAFCGRVWWGLHCPHDGYQNPCAGCGRLPAPVIDGGRFYSSADYFTERTSEEARRHFRHVHVWGSPDAVPDTGP